MSDLEPGTNPATNTGTTRSEPRLTIGLPVYNGERLLAASLDPLLAQTFTDFELIICDSASTDGTERTARDNAGRDPRVRYLRHEGNLGSARNHNFPVEVGRGELFKWASDDDLSARDLLRRCVDALDARPEVVLAHSTTPFIDENGEITNVESYPLQTDVDDVTTRLRSLLYTQGGDDIYGVTRMSVMRAVQPHGSFHHADRTVVADLALHGRFHQVDEALYFRRYHPGRAERAASNLRRRTANLDPSRAHRWAHPAVRLVAEYLASYVKAVATAPINRGDRLRCLAVLAVSVLRHANPLRRRQLLDSPDPAVRAIGAHSGAVRLRRVLRALAPGSSRSDRPR